MGNLYTLKKEQYFDVANTEAVHSYIKFLDCSFKNGERNLGFSSTNYQSGQHKCILIGAQHFNKCYPFAKIAIVTFKWNLGLFKPFHDEGESVDSYTKKFHHHFDLVDWHQLFKDPDIKEKLAKYDFIFWDLPEFEIIKKNYEFLKNQIVFIDSLYIVSLKGKKFSDEDFLKNIQKYYADHGMDITNILPWKTDSEPAQKNLIKRIFGLFNS